ncbi:MAG: CPXCG motif-containing cysteine-rich protein [Verrucomicrobiales bacterium]|nr:CPXCG motif-containing cysteine-rich protein [Verrucomicrobiales bacterium]MED5585884.1 CPXCG motif-containing cysteine-rich protein [Verrucomicrobiota bacterium]
MELLPVTCPSCFETFGVAAPPVDELPADLDYDCEVCCRPMMILVCGGQGEVWAEARGLGD